jgi:Sulfotransferase family
MTESLVPIAYPRALVFLEDFGLENVQMVLGVPPDNDNRANNAPRLNIPADLRPSDQRWHDPGEAPFIRAAYMNRSRTLPNFLMIGAPRTGSTALHYALSEHPDFFLPQVKETHFFSAAADASLQQLLAVGGSYRITRSAEEYAQFFAGAESFRHRGEIDPSILARASHAIPKLRAHLGKDTKWIVVLRQPVERAYSHYLLHTRQRSEVSPFEAYVNLVTPRTAHEIVALDRYFGMSFYFEGLSLFFQQFGRESCLVLLYDDLKNDSHAFLQTILQFLNADCRIVPALLTDINAGGAPKNVLTRLRAPQHPLRILVRTYLPKQVRRYVRSMLRSREPAARDYVRTSLKAETRARLMPRYRDDIFRTQDLIERDLTHWLG